MIRLEDLQPTAAVRGILPDQVVTVVHEPTVIDLAKILRATKPPGVDAQGVENNFSFRGAPFLDACFVAPDPRESEP